MFDVVHKPKNELLVAVQLNPILLFQPELSLNGVSLRYLCTISPVSHYSTTFQTGIIGSSTIKLVMPKCFTFELDFVNVYTHTHTRTHTTRQDANLRGNLLFQVTNTTKKTTYLLPVGFFLLLWMCARDSLMEILLLTIIVVVVVVETSKLKQ